MKIIIYSLREATLLSKRAAFYLLKDIKVAFFRVVKKYSSILQKGKFDKKIVQYNQVFQSQKHPLALN